MRIREPQFPDIERHNLFNPCPDPTSPHPVPVLSVRSPSRSNGPSSPTIPPLRPLIQPPPHGQHPSTTPPPEPLDRDPDPTALAARDLRARPSKSKSKKAWRATRRSGECRRWEGSRRGRPRPAGNPVRRPVRTGPRPRVKVKGRGGRSPADKENKRLKRLLRNRVSAQQARERKKAYLNDLEERVKELEKKNSELEEKLSTLQNENQMLRHILKNTTAGRRGGSSGSNADGPL
ncbi:hypothetical protein NL676_034043 [Syzygium grande]|nr:hypothetical protein NL676_034043 [Syzygium grande]